MAIIAAIVAGIGLFLIPVSEDSDNKTRLKILKQLFISMKMKSITLTKFC